VLLTSTLSAFRVADALLTYMRSLPGYSEVVTLNPVVAETNDSYLSDIWARPITVEHVRAAVENAAGGPVAEGCVGAGTGTGALGFKAGIGTSSRQFPLSTGRPVTVGALVQANFSGVLTVSGVRVGVPADARTGIPVLDSNHVLDPNHALRPPDFGEPAGNSCVIVLATDARLDSRQLERVANRAFPAMARVGSDFSGHSGDYALAVSTAAGRDGAGEDYPVPGKDLDLIFLAAMEASEEAILNSLFMAVTTTGYGGHVSPAVPLDYVQRLVSGRSTDPSAS
jgi:D-aminopeptidase